MKTLAALALGLCLAFQAQATQVNATVNTPTFIVVSVIDLSNPSWWNSRAENGESLVRTSAENVGGLSVITMSWTTSVIDISEVITFTPLPNGEFSFVTVGRPHRIGQFKWNIHYGDEPITTPPGSVPDSGSSAAMVGLGLAGLVGARRYLTFR